MASDKKENSHRFLDQRKEKISGESTSEWVHSLCWYVHLLIRYSNDEFYLYSQFKVRHCKSVPKQKFRGKKYVSSKYQDTTGLYFVRLTF